MRYLLPFLIVLSGYAHADPLTEECENVVKQQALTAGESLKEYAVRTTIDPSARYLHEESVRVCVASKIKMAFYTNAHAKLCPKSKSKYKLECFREWVKAQPIAYSTQVVQLSATAADIARMDRENEELKQEVVLSMLLDSILIPLEKISAPQGGVVRAHKHEDLRKLQENERKLFSKAKMDLIPLMENQIKKMAEAVALEPVDEKTQDWITSSVKALQSRVDRIKLKQI